MAEFETTRKGLAGLLCMALAAAACALALAVAMPGHAFAAAPVCTVNGVEYEDLGTAIDEAPDGAAIVLLDDASVSGVKRMSKSLSIDLGGHVLTCGTLMQSSTSYSLSISSGSVNGLISAKNLTLDGVTVAGNTQNGGVVTASDSSTITNCTITNAYDVVDGRTSAALSVGGSGTHSVTGSVFSGKSAVYINNTKGSVHFDGCTLTGLVSGSSAINAYSSAELNVLFTGCTVTAHESGKAFSGSWNMAGVVEFGQGNTVSGIMQVSGRDTSTNVYDLKITGGTFMAGDAVPFVPQAPEFEAQMLERLNITGGTFAVDVSSLLRSGYECVQNADGTWSVFDDVTASGYYTLADDGSRVKHESIAAAIADGKGAVYVARDAVLSSADAKALSAAGRVLASAPGVTVSFDGTAAELLADLSDAEDLNVTVNAASGTETLRGVGIAGGKLVACTAGITSKNAAAYEPLLAENHVFDTTYSDYRIIALPAEGALIGSFWYADLDAAVTAASIDDVNDPVCETITMLSDAEGPIDIVYPKAMFTIDFAGKTIKGGEGNGIVIAPVVIAGTVQSAPEGCNVTLKNGTVEGGQFAVATNGTLNDVTLTLENMTLLSKGHGMYLAANGSTSIVDSTVAGEDTGIELRAGNLFIDGDSKISGGMGEPDVSANSSGTTSHNAALAVIQHTTKHPINVVIKQGVFEGGAALIEADPHANDAGNVSLEVNDGVFKGAVDSEDCTGFIKGGSFSDEGAGAFVAEDSTLVKGDDGMFGVQKKPESGEGEGGDQGGTDQGGKPADKPGTGSNQGDTLAQTGDTAVVLAGSLALFALVSAALLFLARRKVTE